MDLGYSRKGAALFALKRYSAAVDAYSKGLEIEPNHADMKSVRTLLLHTVNIFEYLSP